MKNKLYTIVALTFCLIGIWTIHSCKKDKEAEGTDKELYDMAKNTNGFVWYKNSSSLLNKSAGSGHPQPFLRTRYNAIAAAKLDSTGKVVSGTIFPEGSLIVKELFNNANDPGRYAILYKKSGSPESDAKGWVWGYVNADGTVAEPSSKRGSACTGCHSQADNIDYMLMNKYFP